MTQAEIAGISPLFIVSDVPAALAFYRDRLGFEITFQGPAPDDIFFGIVRRGGAQILLKSVGVAPTPNYTRDVKKGIARWDAYVDVPDPDALAAEFRSRNVAFSERSYNSEPEFVYLQGLDRDQKAVVYELALVPKHMYCQSRDANVGYVSSGHYYGLLISQKLSEADVQRLSEVLVATPHCGDAWGNINP